MAVYNIIPFGTTTATSSEISIGANTVATFTGWGPAEDQRTPWICQIDVKMSNNEWATIGELSLRNPRDTVFGEGTYRVRRTEGTCLVDIAVGA